MGESRAYRLKEGEAIADGVRRIARGRIDNALDELSGRTASSPEVAVHEARKDMKKLRALLRLVRGELGPGTFARENKCFRDAARELAGARDADVMLETLSALELPQGLGWELRKRVLRARSEDAAHDRSTGVGVATAILEEARNRVDGWALESDGFEALADGLERTYRRGRREFRNARAEPNAEALHEWRKRVKQLWYHHTLLRDLWPPVMGAAGDEAHVLSDRLGDEHDLVLLAAWVGEHADAPGDFFEAIERRRAELRRESLELGVRVYAEKPKAFVTRLGRLWDARETVVRAP